MTEIYNELLEKLWFIQLKLAETELENKAREKGAPLDKIWD